MKALVTSEDVARAVNWLASPGSSGINGQFIRVDNGWSQIRAI
jgi:NAD(P)-dependent dehydrogenase (short-subunit alcohol dehydrogenase family)